MRWLRIPPGPLPTKARALANSGHIIHNSTAASLLLTALTGPIIGATDYLTRFSANADQIRITELVGVVNAAATLGIVISLYPVLRNCNVGLALGAFGFRLIETVLDIAGVVSLVLLLTVSKEFVSARAPASSHFQTIGAVLLAGYYWMFDVGVLLIFCLGALMYYYIFYQTRLVP